MKWIVNKLRKINISTRVFLVVSFCIILFTSVMLHLAQKLAVGTIERNYFKNTEWTQDEMAKGVELFISDLNMLSIRIMNNDELGKLLGDDTLPYAYKLSKYRQILDNMVDWNTVGDVVVVDKAGQVLSVDKKNFSGSPDKRSIRKIESSNQLMWVDTIETGDDGTHYVRLGRKYNYYSTARWIGYLFIYVPETVLFNSFEDMSGSAAFSMIVTGDAVVLSCRDKEKVGSSLFDKSLLNGSGFRYSYMPYQGQDCIISVKDIDSIRDTLGCDLKTVVINPKRDFYQSILHLKRLILIVQIAVTLFALFLSYIISRRIVEPIHKLQEKLNDFGIGDELKPVYLKNIGDEIQELENTYNEMIERITELVRKNNEEKIEQRKLQLIALQAQINPHFLYNTLDTIIWIAKIKKQKEIEDLAMALTGFFRISLHKGDKYILVRDEIEFVNNFVKIQQIRFPNKFEINYDIQEDTGSCRILKIIIQPFVENAIKHGIGPKNGMGHITERGYKKDEDLIFEVIDDGVGFDEHTKKQKAGENGGLNGYGVKNVHERIQLEYGQDYGVSIASIPGEGTRVTIKVRCEWEPQLQ